VAPGRTCERLASGTRRMRALVTSVPKSVRGIGTIEMLGAVSRAADRRGSANAMASFARPLERRIRKRDDRCSLQRNIGTNAVSLWQSVPAGKKTPEQESNQRALEARWDKRPRKLRRAIRALDLGGGAGVY